MSIHIQSLQYIQILIVRNLIGRSHEHGQSRIHYFTQDARYAYSSTKFSKISIMVKLIAICLIRKHVCFFLSCVAQKFVFGGM